MSGQEDRGSGVQEREDGGGDAYAASLWRGHLYLVDHVLQPHGMGFLAHLK
jgi:hypothetical protein